MNKGDPRQDPNASATGAEDNGQNYQSALKGAGKGLGKGAKKTGKGLKNAPKRAKQAKNGAKHAKNGAEKGAGLGMQAGGKALKGAGSMAKGAGKGAQAAGKAAQSVPVVGQALGGGLNALGKGAEGAGKGAKKVGKGVDKAGKKLRQHASKSKVSKLKKHFAFILANLGWIAVALFILLFLVGMMLIASITSDDDEASSCDSGGGDPGITVSGKNNPAKVYNFLVSKEKFSAAGAAGAVGRAMVESGQSVDPHAYNPSGSVIGIFQWGAGGANGDRLESGGFVKAGDGSTHTLTNELKLTDYELHHAYKPYLSTFQHEKDPSTAAEDWTVHYEGAKGQKDADAQSNARQVYSKFDGKGSSSSDADDTADSGDDDSSSDSADCDDDSGSADSADGTGSISEHPNGQNPATWKVDQVPSDVKKYIHSPKDAGMSWGSSKGWADTSGPAGECPTFSNSFFDAIWGFHYVYSADGGNGSGAVKGWKSHMPDGTVSKTPHAGAIAASRNSALATPLYGHTFVVEHVFKNGDYLIAEENWINGVSGIESGKTWDWNYAVVSSKEQDVQFYMPPKKYKLHWTKKK